MLQTYNLPVPVCSRQGKRTVGGDRPVQHRAEHREHFQERGTHFHDRPEYDKKFSRDGEDLRAGQEVLRRCARIGDIINVALASY